ncbi:CHY zinc finger protein [Algoriphagus persicinus]|uniref:CHY zinc finger protein n=1 Tax=Algoriphagus persicinus TaxID=3108754 RepID=UPI002B371D1A|nr:CHY zinc finger protein [Algoriphagus sp. E1-3-M2]MEB2784042.1 CHY zinc finger protein [Algoriphagus sp. E1-3-M2]
MKSFLKLAFISGILLFSGGLLAQQNAALPIVKSSIKGINIYGKTVDNQTRCQHWHSDLDVIAIKFKCCEKYYPCFSCHEEEAGHKPEVWPKTEFDSKAILCGVCGTELTISDYQASGNTCPSCTAAFNPGCSKHYHLYFETDSGIK